MIQFNKRKRSWRHLSNQLRHKRPHCSSGSNSNCSSSISSSSNSNCYSNMFAGDTIPTSKRPSRHSTHTLVIVSQFKAVASDGAQPPKTATTNIVIKVRRDLRAPRFEGAPYKKTISENFLVGQNMFDLRGRDDDKMVRLVFYCSFYYLYFSPSKCVFCLLIQLFN